MFKVATSSVGSWGAVKDKSTEGKTGLCGKEGTGAILEGAGSAGVIGASSAWTYTHAHTIKSHKNRFTHAPKYKE